MELTDSNPPPSNHKGWHSRGYLPHFDEGHLIQSITFRLADSLPQHVSDALNSLSHDECYHVVEKSLDRNYGECWLQQCEIAQLVQESLLYFDGTRYRLLGWVIMPNHVHCVVEQHQDWPLGKIVGTWKSYTAHAANQKLGRIGAFWQEDYFDRYVRDSEHFENITKYIAMNPVKAGLAATPESWRWSSSSRRWEAPGPGAVRLYSWLDVDGESEPPLS